MTMQVSDSRVTSSGNALLTGTILWIAPLVGPEGIDVGVVVVKIILELVFLVVVVIDYGVGSGAGGKAHGCALRLLIRMVEDGGGRCWTAARGSWRVRHVESGDGRCSAMVRHFTVCVYCGIDD